MMSHYFPIPIFFLIMLKAYIFFSGAFFMDINFLFMISIFPLVFFLVFKVLFNTSEVNGFRFYEMIFFFFFFFSFFFFCSETIFLFLLFLESNVIFMIFFLFDFSKDQDKISSVIFMFFINSLGSIPFMYFCSLFSHSFSSNFYVSSWFLGFFIIFCSLLIFCSKLPFVFLHFWLTKAHVSASGSGSMILASLMLKIGSVGMYKLFSLFLSNTFKKMKFFIFCVSLLGSIFLLVVMIRFFDLKYMVACSSIVHMSMIFPFLSFFSPLGVCSSFLMMVGHGLISCFIFFLVTLVYEISFNRSIELNKSVESFSKTLGLFIFLFFLMNMGFPPFLSFLSEILFFCLVIDFGIVSSLIFSGSLMMVGLVFMKIVISFFFGKNISFFTGGVGLSISCLSLFYLFFFFFAPLMYF